MSTRILFVGENWHGSNATSCLRAFRHLGCDVLSVDDFHFFPKWNSFSLRVMRRLTWPLIAIDFSNSLRNIAKIFRPDLVFVFKGVMVYPKTLDYFHGIGAKNVIFYPDVDLVRYYSQARNSIWSCIPKYDVFFSPKSYQLDLLRKSGATRVEFLPYAFDPWCHYRVEPSQYERELLSSSVVFIGSWRREREKILEDLISYGLQGSLNIWGGQWEKIKKESAIRKYVKFSPAYGETQAKIFSSSKIALAFLSPPDLHTARSFEIPAYGAFMLAERTTEHTTFFKEGEEIACFSNVAELSEKINYYLSHEDERKKVALAGFQKVHNEGHSYVDRMKEVLRIFREIS